MPYHAMGKRLLHTAGKGSKVKRIFVSEKPQGCGAASASGQLRAVGKVAFLALPRSQEGA